MNQNKRTPQVRFKGYTDTWEQRKLGNLVKFSKGAGYSKGDLKKSGTPIILYGRLYTKYETVITDVDTFVDARNNSVYSCGGEVIVPASGETAEEISVASVVEKSGVLLGSDLNIITPPPELDSAFLAINISNGKPHNDMAKMAQGKSVVHLHNNDLEKIELVYPSYEEQIQTSTYFEYLSDLITLHQRKYNKLLNLKKAMLQKMFPQNGCLYPEIRFKGFADAWEQHKFADIVQIERGGSPRPIDDYITDSPKGLNWVKIGDAPLQGNYITKTAEKIRPEGLSKTREVHPGDLILSNSMSFGRPYIMGIDGCIHDGWLLIRDINNIFDLAFLCYLLGTPQMLEQYRSLAAGSTVNNLNKQLVGNTIVVIPKIDEQRVLGKYLEQIDNLITLHQRKLEKLKQIRKSCLEKMFV